MGLTMCSRGSYTQIDTPVPYGSKEQPPIHPVMREGTRLTNQTRSHPYHEYGFPVGGAWNQVILDDHYSMLNTTSNGDFWRGWWPAKDGLVYDYHGDMTNTYFDVLSWTYFFLDAFKSAWPCVPTREYGSFFCMGPEEYYVEDHAKDRECDRFIHSIMGSYHPNNGPSGFGEFAVSFGAFAYAPYMCEVVYAFEDMHQWNKDNPGSGTNAFDVIGMKPATHCTDKDGNPLLPGTNNDAPGTSVMPYRYWEGDTRHDYNVHMNWWTKDINPADVPPNAEFPDRKVVYFAIRPLESTWDADEVAWYLNEGDPTYENKCGPWSAHFGGADSARKFRQIAIAIHENPTDPCPLPPHLKRTPENI